MTAAILSRGDVVFVPFYFTNLRTVKNRPAVVVSSDVYNAGRHEVIIAGITSNLKRTNLVGSLVIEEWRECGLRLPSAVSGIIMTVREAQIGERMGRLTTSDLKRLEDSLRFTLGL